MQYARQIGAAVLAEGAETREELATLIELGVTYGQGYLLGKPSDDYRGITRDTREWMRERARQAAQNALGQPATVGAMAWKGVALPLETPLSELVRRFTKDAGGPASWA